MSEEDRFHEEMVLKVQKQRENTKLISKLNEERFEREEADRIEREKAELLEKEEKDEISSRMMENTNGGFELPRYALIQTSQKDKRYLRYNTENPEVPEAVRFVGEYSHGTETQFEVVPAAISQGLIHIHCMENLKYLANFRDAQNSIAACADEPVEHLVPHCTLFQPIFFDSNNNRVLKLLHVQTKMFVEFFHGHGPTFAMLRLGNSGKGYGVCTFLDWGEVPLLPKFIRIKGDNGYHLKASADGFMDFLEEADDSSLFDYEVLPSHDGGVCLQSTHFGTYWTAEPGDTWVLSKEASAHDNNTVFIPTRHGGKGVTFRSLKNGMVCQRYTTADKQSCLATVLTDSEDTSYMKIEDVSRVIQKQTATNARLTSTLPKYVIIQTDKDNKKYLRLNSDNPKLPEAVRFVRDYSFGIDTRFEVVQATIGTGNVHIRCLANNKYLECFHGHGGSWIVASADKPEENQTDERCTLFQPVFSDSSNNRVLRLRHVKTKRFIEFFRGPDLFFALVALKTSNDSTTDVFTFIDCRSITVLPNLIRIKGHNGNYLKPYEDGFMDFQFKADNSSLFDFEVLPSRDGGVRLRSIYYNKYWTAYGTWVWVEPASTEVHKTNTVFLPSKRDDHFLFRCLSSDKFCRVHSTDEKTSCLAALDTYPDPDWSKMEIEEPFILRRIENVIYDLKKIRRYNERTTGIWHDDSSHGSHGEYKGTLKLKTKVTNKAKWSTSTTLGAGATITVSAGKPEIFSFEAEGSFEEGDSRKTETEETETVEVGSVKSITLPPMTRVMVKLMETRLSYEVPFSYTLIVVSRDGRITVTEMDDGLFTGENGYDYRYEVFPLPFE